MRNVLLIMYLVGLVLLGVLVGYLLHKMIHPE